MTTAQAASEVVTHTVSQQLTHPSMLLLAMLLLVMAGLAIWSWLYRKKLAHQRRNAEAALREVERQHSHLFDILPIALFSFEPGNGFISVSDGIARLLPVTVTQLIDSPATLVSQIEPADRAGLEWLCGTASCPAQFEWVGRVVSDNRQDTQRWLQIRTYSDIGPNGERRVVGMLLDVTPLKAAQAALEASREEVRRMAAHRESERENAYLHLAREFHDELGQVLTSAKLRLQLLAKAPADSNRAAVEELEVMLTEAYRSVKAIVTDLRPPALNLGFAIAVEWQAERTLSPVGVRFTSAIRLDPAALPESVKVALFRITQEAFTNIALHANAKHVHLSLRADSSQLFLEISDDGVGFCPDTVDGKSHFGLTGMRERAIALGGKLVLDSGPDEGARVLVVAPLSHPGFPR